MLQTRLLADACSINRQIDYSTTGLPEACFHTKQNRTVPMPSWLKHKYLHRAYSHVTYESAVWWTTSLAMYVSTQSKCMRTMHATAQPF